MFQKGIKLKHCLEDLQIANSYNIKKLALRHYVFSIFAVVHWALMNQMLWPKKRVSFDQKDKKC